MKGLRFYIYIYMVPLVVSKKVLQLLLRFGQIAEVDVCEEEHESLCGGLC